MPRILITAILFCIGYVFSRTFGISYDFPNREILIFTLAFALSYFDKYPRLNSLAVIFALSAIALYVLSLVVELPVISSIEELDISKEWIYRPGLGLAACEIIIFWGADLITFPTGRRR
ncbi:MAG: hypothetical protein HQ591_06845 [candidate division Zixibacteria bacterium]|nr:hypothetical protein [Candidatus Tariuqbacter arcticus]